MTWMIGVSEDDATRTKLPLFIATSGPPECPTHEYPVSISNLSTSIVLGFFRSSIDGSK